MTSSCSGTAYCWEATLLPNYSSCCELFKQSLSDMLYYTAQSAWCASSA